VAANAAGANAPKTSAAAAMLEIVRFNQVPPQIVPRINAVLPGHTVLQKRRTRLS